MGTIRLRYRNSPSIKQLIGEVLRENEEGVSLEDIYIYVLPKVKLLGKTPKKSIYSVLTKMTNIQKYSSGKYKLTRE